jgi:hypothetical protein
MLRTAPLHTFRLPSIVASNLCEHPMSNQDRLRNGSRSYRGRPTHLVRESSHELFNGLFKLGGGIWVRPRRS